MAAMTASLVDSGFDSLHYQDGDGRAVKTASNEQLTEISASILLVRDLIVNDQLPHFKADADVKRRLMQTESLSGSAQGLEVLNRVQGLLRPEASAGPPIPTLTSGGQNATTKIVSPAAISFPDVSVSLDQSGPSSLQHRPKKPLRHQWFEPGVQDDSTTVITLQQLETLTEVLKSLSSFRDVVAFEQVHLPKAQAKKTADDEVSSLFDENDYYSSQVESLAGSLSEHKDFRKQQKASLSSSHDVQSDQPSTSSVLRGLSIMGLPLEAVQYTPSITARPNGSGSDEDLYRDRPAAASVASEDYAPPAALYNPSDDGDEYDPTQLDPESDYDPNSLGDDKPVPSRPTPIVTSRVAHIAAPQPSRLGPHAVSIISDVANNGNDLRDQTAVDVPAHTMTATQTYGSAASNPANSATHHSSDLNAALQQFLEASQAGAQNTTFDWNEALKLVAPQPVEQASQYSGIQTEQAKSQDVEASSGNKRRQFAREEHMQRRERKRQRRQAKTQAQDDERTRQAEIPKKIEHPKPQPTQQNIHADHHPVQVASQAMQVGMQPASHHSVTGAGAIRTHEIVQPPAHSAASLQMMPYGVVPPGYGMGYPHPIPSMYAPPPTLMPPLHTGGGRTSVAPLDPSMRYQAPVRILQPGESAIVTDQHGNVYIARPVAPTVPPPPVMYRYPPY
ncbi:hypothetical protein ANO11243_025090 [Dothideomycetidae sp. 11243]|nr:hypothetical protein ANO11243_025090 [fungal sp. No.11243]